jgi:hypothetical protein
MMGSPIEARAEVQRIAVNPKIPKANAKKIHSNAKISKNPIYIQVLKLFPATETAQKIGMSWQTSHSTRGNKSFLFSQPIEVHLNSTN